jgi:uncharacterized protein YciI
MKRFIALTFFITLFYMSVYGQESVSMEFVQAELSKARAYSLAFFVQGPERTEESVELAQKNQMLHLQYLFALKEKNQLLVFGPLTDDSPIKGIMIFNLTDVTEVKKLLDNDPHVKAGHLAYEVHPWFGIPGHTLK